jgi:hypothetical protein
MFGLSDGRAEPIWGSECSDKSRVVDKRMLSREVEPSGAYTALPKNFAVFMKSFKGVIQCIEII